MKTHFHPLTLEAKSCGLLVSKETRTRLCHKVVYHFLLIYFVLIFLLLKKGLGETAPGEQPDHLQHIELTYLEQTECASLYNTLTEDMMCTFEGVGKNICGGDSGGPLYDQTNNIIAGVVSWGVGACGRGNADVYSRIGVQYNTWIKPTICDNHSLPKPDFCPGRNPPLPSPSVDVSYYEADSWSKLPPGGLKKLTPYKTDQVGTINFPLATIRPFAGSNRAYHVAALFEGLLSFPIPGEYLLCLRSDDGSKLFIDDKEFIDHDGTHGSDQKCEKKTMDAAVHKISLEYFQGGGGHALLFLWKTPNSSTPSLVTEYDWVQPTCATVDELCAKQRLLEWTFKNGQGKERARKCNFIENKPTVRKRSRVCHNYSSAREVCTCACMNLL